MKLSQNTQGAVLMTLSMGFFTFNDAFLKLAFESLHVSQAVALRGLFATLFLVFLAWRAGQLLFVPTRAEWRPIVIRVMAEIGAAATFLTALARLPIADATAVLQAAPLAVTLVAALFLREPVGWRRASAIVAGFVGMLLIVRPFTDGFDPAMLLAVATVGFVVLRDFATREMSERTPTLYVSAVSAGAITVAFALVAPVQGWQPLTPSLTGFCFAAALFVIGAYVTSIGAMRVGEVSAVAPFRYTVLVFALLVGLIFFGDVPDGLTLFGAAIVAAAGLYTLWREQVVGHSQAAMEVSARPFAPAPEHRRGRGEPETNERHEAHKKSVL